MSNEYVARKKEYINRAMDAMDETLRGLKPSEVMDVKLDIALSLSLHCIFATDKPKTLIHLIFKTLENSVNEIKEKK